MFTNNCNLAEMSVWTFGYDIHKSIAGRSKLIQRPQCRRRRAEEEGDGDVTTQGVGVRDLGGQHFILANIYSVRWECTSISNVHLAPMS